MGTPAPSASVQARGIRIRAVGQPDEEERLALHYEDVEFSVLEGVMPARDARQRITKDIRSL